MSNERVMRLGLTISAKQSQLTISKDHIFADCQLALFCRVQAMFVCCRERINNLLQWRVAKHLIRCRLRCRKIF